MDVRKFVKIGRPGYKGQQIHCVCFQSQGHIDCKHSTMVLQLPSSEMLIPVNTAFSFRYVS